MGLPTAFVSQEESQSWGRELRESSNANCAKHAIAVRPFSQPTQLDQRREDMNRYGTIRASGGLFIWIALVRPVRISAAYLAEERIMANERGSSATTRAKDARRRSERERELRAKSLATRHDPNLRRRAD